jgi:hypothetical protein
MFFTGAVDGCIATVASSGDGWQAATARVAAMARTRVGLALRLRVLVQAIFAVSLREDRVRSRQNSARESGENKPPVAH